LDSGKSFERYSRSLSGRRNKIGGERLFPLEYQEQLIESADQNERVLLAIDFIASMTEQQALEV